MAESGRIAPTAEDRRHLVQAMGDVADGWLLHPFTCTRFQVLGWLDRSGWTRAAYDVRNEYRATGL